MQEVRGNYFNVVGNRAALANNKFSIQFRSKQTIKPKSKEHLKILKPLKEEMKPRALTTNKRQQLLAPLDEIETTNPFRYNLMQLIVLVGRKEYYLDRVSKDELKTIFQGQQTLPIDDAMAKIKKFLSNKVRYKYRQTFRMREQIQLELHKYKLRMQVNLRMSKRLVNAPTKNEDQNRRVVTEACDNDDDFDREVKMFQDCSNLKNRQKIMPKARKPLIKETQGSSVYLNKFDNSGSKQQTVKKPERKPLSIEKVSAKSILVPAMTERCDYSQCTYTHQKVVGSGSFGVVYKAKVDQTGEIVAIKKVLQDKRYKNRELQILQELEHPNVLRLKHAFFTAADSKEESYLNVVMDFFPETLYSYNKSFCRQGMKMPEILCKIFAYQLLRSICYISQLQICHRDIKPHNILVNPTTNRLQLCDFGSAKKLIRGEPNIAYICSRCYRAPELIFGATDYNPQIDVWSVGCVIAELFNGEPLFLGDSAVDQLVEIVKVLGTPNKQQILSMNKNYDLESFKFVTIKPGDWKKVLKIKDQNALDLVSKLLTYCPKTRLTPSQALSHTYFDELRDFQALRNIQNIDKIVLPELFDFLPEETATMTPQMQKKLVPDWYSQASKILKTVG